MNKRGYFVNSVDEPSGFAVVATSVKEAKQIAYQSGELYTDCFNVTWTDIRVHWKRDADVSMLPIGMVGDARVGLLCGLYGFLEEYPCEVCGKDGDCHAYDNKVICECCLGEIKED